VGQEKDPETGWEPFELRIACPETSGYDGRVGRWMTTDPYSQYHSPYLAMGNNPINMVDPDGGNAFNWYGDGSGNFIWREGSAAEISVDGRTYKDAGSTLVTQNLGQVYIYDQNNLAFTFSMEEMSTPQGFMNISSSVASLSIDMSRVAIGYEFSVGANASFLCFGGTGRGSSGKVMFLGGDYGGYWHSYLGYSGGLQGTATFNANVDLEFSAFIGFNHSGETDPYNFVGRSSYVTGSADGAFLGLGAGLSVNTTISRDWFTFGVGINGSAGFEPAKATVTLNVGRVNSIYVFKPIKNIRHPARILNLLFGTIPTPIPVFTGADFDSAMSSGY
jgi:RHS repeat-associated protein